MSSPTWDFPSSSANPTVDDEDMEREELEREQIEALERELLAQLERDQIEAPEQNGIEALERRQRDEQLERERIEALEREQREERLERERIVALEQQMAALEQERREEQLEREQIEALEREHLAQMGHLDGAAVESSEQSEREQLEELERESLRQLEQLGRRQNGPVAAAAPRPSDPAPPARPGPDGQRGAPSAPVADERPDVDAESRAAQFLAAANARQALLDEAARGVRPSAAATERRELNERARAARVVVEHRHRNLVEANALLGEARRVLAPIAYRGLSDSTYLRRKIILGIGEAVSLAVAFSAAFDVAPVEGLLLSGAIALAFIIAGDLGGVLRLTSERSRLSAALEDDVVHLDPRYLHILYHDKQPWLSIVGGVTAAVFALATVSVGVLRAANQGSLGLAAGLGLLTISLAIAAGLSSWQHASLGSEIIDHLQREEQAAARRLKRAAAARVLRKPQVLTVVGGDELEMPSRGPEVDWQSPEVDWQSPMGERPARRPKRGGRAARERPAKREKSSGSGLVGAAAARGAVFLATLPGKLRRPEDAVSGPKKASKKESRRESKIEDMSVSGDGPGALGESAGPISAVTFTPPVRTQKKFGSP